MRNCSPWLYYDIENHIWRFYVKNTGEFMYSIMYEEDKWTKENKIDNGVLDFTVNVDSERKVYIIYSIKGGELKYCIWENNQWFGKTLYRFENEHYQINEVSVSVIGENTHIFFIAKNNSNVKQCSLTHLCWSNDGNLFNTISNISLIQETYFHYQTVVFNDGRLCLLFINDEENEVVIKFTEYKDQKWSIPRRLYGINGTNINFCTLQHNNMISILNLSKESSIYSLEHVLIEYNGKMKSSKIYEGSVEPNNYLLLEMDDILWAMWSEDRKILFSSYKGQWSAPIKYNNELNEQILTYKYLSLNNKFKNVKANCVLGTNLPEIKLLLPENKENAYTNDTQENSKEDTINTLGKEDDLITLKKSNMNLEKKIIDLLMQLQQKQKIIEGSDGNFLKLISTKKKVEEKLSLITEIQQTSIKELETMKKQQLARDTAIDELKNKLRELRSENDQLKIELKYEKSKGLIDRILNKKPDV